MMTLCGSSLVCFCLWVLGRRDFFSAAVRGRPPVGGLAVPPPPLGWRSSCVLHEDAAWEVEFNRDLAVASCGSLRTGVGQYRESWHMAFMAIRPRPGDVERQEWHFHPGGYGDAVGCGATHARRSYTPQRPRYGLSEDPRYRRRPPPNYDRRTLPLVSIKRPPQLRLFSATKAKRPADLLCHHDPDPIELRPTMPLRARAMFRSTGWLASWLGGIAALMLIAGFPGQRASAQGLRRGPVRPDRLRPPSGSQSRGSQSRRAESQRAALSGRAARTLLRATARPRVRGAAAARLRAAVQSRIRPGARARLRAATRPRVRGATGPRLCPTTPS